MALIVPLTLPASTTLVDGVAVEVPETTYQEAYARVVVSRAHADTSYVCVGWYASEESRFAEGPIVKLHEFFVPTADLKGDYFPAVYSHLKSLPEFAGAIDHPVVDPAEPAPTQAAAQA